MPKFSGTKRRPLRANPTAPIRTTNQRTFTHEGGAAFVRDVESELFLLAATNMVGEDTFYEGAADGDARFVDLVRDVTASNPGFIAGADRRLRSSCAAKRRTSPSVVSALPISVVSSSKRVTSWSCFERSSSVRAVRFSVLAVSSRSSISPLTRPRSSRSSWIVGGPSAPPMTGTSLPDGIAMQGRPM